jgi:hypothetical protein
VSEPTIVVGPNQFFNNGELIRNLVEIEVTGPTTVAELIEALWKFEAGATVSLTCDCTTSHSDYPVDRQLEIWTKT